MHMMLYGYHFSTIEHNWEDLKPLNEFLQTFADDDGDVSTRDKESLKEIIAKSDTALALAREMGWDGSILAALIYSGYQVKIANLLNMALYLNRPQIIQLL